MEIARIKVIGVRAVAVTCREIPRGIIGATISIEYGDAMWDALSKTVVFSGSGMTKDILDAGETVTVPVEVVSRASSYLRVGVYGTDAENNIAIPTIWADLGKIQDAANPSGDESTDPSLPVWVQLQEQINDLKENGTGGGGGGGYTPITINGEGPDKNGNFVINTLNDAEIAQLASALT